MSEPGSVAARRIGAFFVGTFWPSAVAIGGALKNNSYASLSLEATIVGSALAWGLCWFYKRAASWRFIFIGGWVIAALITLAVILIRDYNSAPEPASEILGTAVFGCGVNALSFRLLAFAFNGPKSAQQNTIIESGRESARETLR